MSNDFYTASGNPGSNAAGLSATMRSEFALIETGFTKLVSPTGNSLKLVRINTGGTAYEAVDGSTLYLTPAAAAATYLTIATAASTYLTQANAASTYLTIANAASTYLTQANAASTYLTQANATSTYLPLAGGTMSGSITGLVNLTTTGNTILGNAQADTLNVGNGDIIKDATGNVGIGVSPGTKLDVFGNYAVVRNGTFAGYFGYGSLATGGAASDFCVRSDNAMTFSVGGTTLAMSITSTGVVKYGGIEVGFRAMPSASVLTGAVIAADAGKCVYASGGVTIPNSTFAGGDVLTIYNDTSAGITITAGITTLRWAGTATTGPRTLAQRGIASILFRSGTEAIISGTGLS